jgi:hypothetical protein
MRYTLLFFDEGRARAQLAMSDWRALTQAHHVFHQRLADGGVTVVERVVLEPDMRTSTLTFDGGAAIAVRGGPHAQSRWVLGGFYIVEHDDAAALTDLVRSAPLPHGAGYVEIRPVV